MITIFVSLEKIALSCEGELQKQQHIYLLENDSAQFDLRQQVGWFEMTGVASTTMMMMMMETRNN